MLTEHPPLAWARVAFSLAMSEPQLWHLQGVQITPTSWGLEGQDDRSGVRHRNEARAAQQHPARFCEQSRDEGTLPGPQSWRSSPGKGCVMASAEQGTERSAHAHV